jgi:prepilin-type N-terminal cleavage/methylation domain-containing protein/prepilin-type processing-associated H-X9-DG protein
MTRSRKAFTLVELLVVIAIIGIIMSMLLPAIQAARHSAWKLQCSNKLKQLAIATKGHEASKGRLPGAMEVVGGKRASWVVPLFPYVGEQQLNDRWTDPTVTQATANTHYIKLFICTARPGLDTSVASNSYIANIGFGPRGSDPSPFGPAATATAPTSSYDYWVARRKANDPFVDRYTARANGWKIAKTLITVSSTDFRDGTSNTILFSENLAAGQWHVTGLPTGMVWLYANESGVPVNSGYETQAVLAPSAVPAVARINGNKMTLASVTAPEHARPSSMHSGGVNVAFADGSVHFLNEKIVYHVYQSLLTLHDRHSDMPYRLYVLNGNDFEQ